jgi:hypothetical protein
LTVSTRPSEAFSRTRTLLHIEALLAKARGRAGALAEAACLAVIFGFCLEAACRVEDWIEFRTPIFALERSQEDLLIRDSLGMHGRPSGRFKKWQMNSLGMRGPEVSRSKPTDVLRVVTSGASETFGLYESPNREYPRQLEDTLNARFAVSTAPCSVKRVEVLNAAMPGMSLPTIEQDIRLRVGPLHPDFVVLYPTPPGYLYDKPPVAAAPLAVGESAGSLPESNALAPRVLDRLRNQIKDILPNVIQDQIRRRQIDKMVAERAPGWRFQSVPLDRIAAFETDLRNTIATIQAAGAEPVIVTHGNRFVGSNTPDEAALRGWEKFYPRAPGRVVVAFDSAARLATIAAARDSKALLVDLAPELAQTGVAAFADYAHFTDVGAGVAAHAVAEGILRAEGAGHPAACAAAVK